jgi:NADH dehydrogenase (ubiquinone) 1 beta subcomplex subunit 7
MSCLAMQVSDEECAKHMIPHFLRDNCAHLLIPLDKCRKQTGYMPWACKELRHEYEACQYRE